MSMQSSQDYESLIAVAHGEIEADLLLEGAELVDVHSGSIRRSDVAVFGDRISGFDCPSAKRVLDLSGSIIAPGFIDAHVHLESSMVTPPQYARAVVPHGTTAVIADPHEIANVLGVEGVRFFQDSSRDLALRIYFMAPSCVPATGLETSGAVLGSPEIEALLSDPRVLGLGEMMNFPGVIRRDPAVLEKICLAKACGKRIDGHAPGLSGHDLAAYAAAGIESDHECTTAGEAEEKLQMGMRIMIREGSAARNLDSLLPLVTPANSGSLLFCSDDRSPSDILEGGHIDSMVRRAVLGGVDLVTAVRIASLNAARYFGIIDTGAVAPGNMADIAVLDGGDLRVKMVLVGGRVVAKDGKMVRSAAHSNLRPRPTMNAAAISTRSFEIKNSGGPARVIAIVPGQIVTKSMIVHPLVKNGLVIADLERDILPLAVVERHRRTENVGLGLVSGFRLQAGAIATSVAHDSHNICVVGVSSAEMAYAVGAVVEMGGGLVAIRDGHVMASLPLPVAGLLSDRSMEEVAAGIDSLAGAARELGSALHDPFMTLSFLALPVIPELKLTDRGLVDVTRFQHIPLFVQDEARR